MQFIPDSFLVPWRLWLLLGVAALAMTYLVAQRRRTQYAVRFTNLELLDKVAPSRPGWRRHIPAATFLLAITSLIVAFARPSQDTEVPKEQATIVLAIDTSLSMEANDVRPTRLEGAKEAAIGFIEDLPDQINVGLISFNGVATIRVTPSQNHDAAIAAIDSLELGPATAIGEAIFAGLDAIDELADENGEAPPARLVVMSDGETTVGRADEDAIVAAQQAAIPVSTIAFGTADGQIIIPEEPLPIAVPVNLDKLQRIALDTGGDFFSAQSTNELAAVYEDIGSQIAFETINDEISTTYTGLGLILLAITAPTQHALVLSAALTWCVSSPTSPSDIARVRRTRARHHVDALGTATVPCRWGAPQGAPTTSPSPHPHICASRRQHRGPIARGAEPAPDITSTHSARRPSLVAGGRPRGHRQRRHRRTPTLARLVANTAA